MKVKRKSRLTVTDYVNGILSGDRVLLSRAITLIESSLPSDRILADKIIEKILPKTGQSIRVGITGAPGVGKSTFIETFGKYLTALNKKVAVLAVDPSSKKTKGSILGDKTRMEELAKDSLAFIRPSASNQSLGGVAESTQETILLCEAAGFEIIIVETVGVGQSETLVRNMTDFFLLLMLPGSGDELQGIKKGIMEMADSIAVTKADGDSLQKARQSQTDFQHALHLLTAPESGVVAKVLLTSSVQKKGINEVWSMVTDFKQKTTENGFFFKQRKDQNLDWFRSQISHSLMTKIKEQKKINKEINLIEEKISRSLISPGKAAKSIMKNIKILIPIFLLSIQFSVAQNLSPQSRKTVPSVNDMFNGMPFARPDASVVGDIYIDRHWALTSVELTDSDKTLEWFWTRYDLHVDELEIKTPAGIKVLRSNKIKQFHLKDTTGIDRKFVNASSYKKEGIQLAGVLEQMVEGNRPLFKQYYLEVQKPNYNAALNSGTRDTEIRKEIDYYYAIDNNLIKINTTKKFTASLGEHAEKIAEYVKANHLSVKEERDLVSIFTFYNSLL